MIQERKESNTINVSLSSQSKQDLIIEFALVWSMTVIAAGEKEVPGSDTGRWNDVLVRAYNTSLLIASILY